MKQSRKVGKKIIDEVEMQIQQLLQLRESLNQTTIKKRDELGLEQEEEQKAPKDQTNILVSDDDSNNEDKVQHTAVDAADDKEF